MLFIGVSRYFDAYFEILHLCYFLPVSDLSESGVWKNGRMQETNVTSPLPGSTASTYRPYALFCLHSDDDGPWKT